MPGRIAKQTREETMDFPILSDWAALADCTPQPRPIALAFFAPAAFREFLKAVPERDDDQDDDKDAEPAAETGGAE
jgi:hypothetical protein